MALPPASLLTKRKRGDLPVELLYLQEDATRQKRRVTFQNFRYELVTRNHQPQARLPPQITTPAESPRKISQPAPTFHLTQETRHARSSGPISSGHKRKHSDVAVFAPAKQRLNRSPARTHATGEVASTANANSRESIRKRPTASSAEKKWREETWTPKKGTTNKLKMEGNTEEEDVKSEALAASLQDFAEEQAKLDEAGTLKKNPLSTGSQIRLPSGSEDVAMDIVSEDEEYLYDEYRRVQISQDAEISKSKLRVGYLVIRNEDEDLWETFYDDAEEETPEPSDDEDSNAEDFYGNDYPEDELSSSDEMGRNAYHYRRNASDDEEYGESNDEHEAWSDDEDNVYGAGEKKSNREFAQWRRSRTANGSQNGYEGTRSDAAYEFRSPVQKRLD